MTGVDEHWPDEESYGAQPPSDLGAEQCVIGSALLSKKALNTLTTLITPADFYRPIHGDIFSAATALASAGEPVDAMTVARELETRGQLKKIGGAPYLLTCMENTPTATNAEAYARMVLDKAKLRRLDELGTRLKALAYSEATTSDDVNALMGQGEKFFRSQHEPDDTAVSFDGMVASWEEWQATDVGSIQTPWEALNARLNGGLQRGRLYTIAARPGVGKSVAALQMAAFAAHWGFPAAYFTLEMSKDEVTSRLISAGSNTDFSKIMQKRLDLQDREKIDRYLKDSRNQPLQTVDRSRVTVEQIVAHCRSLGKLDVLVVDYLQLMSASDTKASREQQVAHMSRSLKIAAKELDVAVIACSQLNRGPVKDGKPRAPTIGDLRESGAIEQDSDVVLLLHTDEDDPGIIQMIIGKNRNGRMGDLMFNFEGHYQRIT
ncbi:DnaB-like replicative helicase [Mycobacterium phage DyoEdafos]|uniref:DNA 5'-3' helicase n=1 Tax=Mycobacterium phage DyoEdafos TaxID=2599860 RepID=A0A5J6THA6_9CAUD|nr:DnaB-like replicative helicase [Mycobacterium phage DyoEdafos]QFG10301.1 DnaB-like dsDNA helicase [Mycobacterium phage DyoEdafos]